MLRNLGILITQVPAPEQVVAAAVRSSEQQHHVVREVKEVPIPPKPVIMHQDVSSTRGLPTCSSNMLMEVVAAYCSTAAHVAQSA